MEFSYVKSKKEVVSLKKKDDNMFFWWQTIASICIFELPSEDQLINLRKKKN
jgi:hypothetical protein